MSTLRINDDRKPNWPMIIYCITITIFFALSTWLNYYLSHRVKEIAEVNSKVIEHFQEEIVKINGTTKLLINTHREYQELQRALISTVEHVLTERGKNENLHRSQQKNKKNN